MFLLSVNSSNFDHMSDDKPHHPLINPQFQPHICLPLVFTYHTECGCRGRAWQYG